jgi:hypothetical protein
MYRDIPKHEVKYKVTPPEAPQPEEDQNEEAAHVKVDKHSNDYARLHDEFENRVGITPKGEDEQVQNIAFSNHDFQEPDHFREPQSKPEPEINGEGTSKYWSQTEESTDFSKSVAFRGSSRRRGKPMVMPEPEPEIEEEDQDIDNGIDKKAYLNDQSKFTHL